MYKRIVTIYRVERVFFLLFFAACVIVTPFNGGAEATEWLVPPSFEGEELKRVREWEKTWAGKTINRSNVDQVKEFLPDGLYEVMTDTSKWGDFDYSFKVVPYQPYKPTAGLIEATSKYSPLAKIDKDDIAVDYHKMAGVLFPKPKTGLEAVWNYFTWSRGDDYVRPRMMGSPVDIRTKIERGAISSHWSSYYVNRVNIPPVPSVPKNRRKIRKARFMHMEAPPNMTDFCSLHVQYIDLSKEDDGWMYWPRFRKITRIQTDVRDDIYDGLDWIQDDFPDGFDGKPDVFNYKLLGRKKLLLSRHIVREEYRRDDGMAIFGGIHRELVNVYVVEAAHKKPGYVYDRFLFYFDPELWGILYKVVYNKQGQLWKVMEVGMEVNEIYGAELPVPETYQLVDLIRRHSTIDLGRGTDLTYSNWTRGKTFSIRNLDRRAY